MKNVMVDLETLGQAPGCIILSIGAVRFDETGLGDGFYAVINSLDCFDHGLTTDPSTLDWWKNQSPEAREVLEEADGGGLPLALALAEFNEFLAPSGMSSVKVWGNGSDFDNAILGACYRAVGSSHPWAFWNNRCFRTLKALNPNVKMDRTGTYHNALDDAITQARHAVQLLR